jgi:LPXTG-site transpeptidase (sortase) family protein
MAGLVLGGVISGPGLASADDTSDEDAPDLSTPDQLASYGPSAWMRIPRIELDSATVDVDVIDGYYAVPWFDVGHHADSANPGESGNSIFNGHVLTINAGRVFYRLKELEPGDAVFVYTPDYRTGWAVASTFAVADGNDAFLTQTDVPQLTLYTCTGAFNPLERSYAERLVVVSELIEVVPRS